MSGQIKQSGYSDSLFKVYDNTFVRDGYDFVCWNTKKDGSGIAVEPNSLLSCQNDITLYAQWKLVYMYMQLERSGNLYIDNNTTCFDENSFEYTPININWTVDNSFELVLKMTVSYDEESEDSAVQTIFTMDTGNNNENFSLILKNAALVFTLTNSTSSVTLNNKTTYYVKFIKNATTYCVLISTDGIAYNTVIETTSSLTCLNRQMYFGKLYSISYIVDVEYSEQVPVYSLRLVGLKTGTVLCRSYGEVHRSINELASNGYRITGYNDTGQGWAPWWVDYSYNVYEKYVSSYNTVWHTRPEERFNKSNVFNGIIDFNDSYIVVNDFKYKLKA